MSVEAMYSLEFAAPGDGDTVWCGAGVVVLDTDRIFGGDHQYAYVGGYEAKDGSITAEVRVFQHSAMAGGMSIFGTTEKEFKVELKGEAVDSDYTGIDLKGHRAGIPDNILVARARRIAELP